MPELCAIWLEPLAYKPWSTGCHKILYELRCGKQPINQYRLTFRPYMDPKYIPVTSWRTNGMEWISFNGTSGLYRPFRAMQITKTILVYNLRQSILIKTFKWGIHKTCIQLTRMYIWNKVYIKTRHSYSPAVFFGTFHNHHEIISNITITKCKENKYIRIHPKHMKGDLRQHAVTIDSIPLDRIENQPPRNFWECILTKI